jgi:hypothetical protein
LVVVRIRVLNLITVLGLALAAPAVTSAQDASRAAPGGVEAQAAQAAQSDTAASPGASSREAAIEAQQATKATELHEYVPNKAERIFDRLDTLLSGGMLRWHPYFESAYAGGGFTLGAGHVNYVSAYNYIDARASYTIANYKRAEVEFVAPRLFNRRGHLSVVGGWREATQVGFYGIGTSTSKDDRTNYLFQQPYGRALLTVFPTRRALMLRGGVELTQWSQDSGDGRYPSVETRYTPETLPGLGAEVTYLHTQGTVAFDWRPSPGYARRGGFYGATLHDYSDRDDDFGFQVAEYEAIQHIPILREAWVLSFHARVQTAFDKSGQETPFFMLPALGGGSSLRGYASWRFRDKNSLLLQGEWRVMVNRYLDLAFFYDAGKVTARTRDLDLDGLKDDFGVGVRFHGPFATPLRVELARSHEGTAIVFSANPIF